MRKGTFNYVVIIVAFLCTGCKGSSVKEKQMEYAVLSVGYSNVTTINKYPALIQGRQDVEIYPQITGKITAVCVTEGKRVKKGQTLFIIDQVPYKAALQIATANYSAAKAQVATARLNYNGKKELYNCKVISSF